MVTAVERETRAIKSEAKKILMIVLAVSLVVYSLTGTAQVGQQETGLVIRFGTVVKTLPHGLYWGYPWPIDKVVKIPTGPSHSLEVRDFNLDPQEVSQRIVQLREDTRYKALDNPVLAGLVEPYLITGDMNVIHLDLRVIYTITDPKAYYLAAGDVSDLMQTNVQLLARQIIANAVIQAVGDKEVMSVLSEGQTDVKLAVLRIVQQQFDQLALGITISQTDAVGITTCRVPTSLQEVFNEVTTARDRRNDLVNRAQAEANRTIDEAKAQVAQIEADANAYYQSVVSQARGEAERFGVLIDKYQQEGLVVRDRLRNEKLTEVAPYLKAPTVYAVPGTSGKQKLVITIPANPE